MSKSGFTIDRLRFLELFDSFPLSLYLSYNLIIILSVKDNTPIPVKNIIICLYEEIVPEIVKNPTINGHKAKPKKITLI
jgi:hypothetical protein